MKIIQVVATINKDSDGVNHAVRGLSRGLAAHGVEVSLHCLDEVPERVRDSRYESINYPRKRFPLPSIGRSPELLKGLTKVCQSAEIIHSNGLWMMPNIYPEWAIRSTKCKLVVQPHGTLSKWAMRRSWWKKLPIWWLWQKRVLDKTEMFIATCDEEYQDIRRLGYKQPVAILPNGVDLPKGASRQLPVQRSAFGVQSSEFKVSSSELQSCGCVALTDNKQQQTANSKQLTDASHRRRMYFLSRIHPKKNVELLLRCWAKLESEFADWDLSIVGPDKNNPYADEMKQLAKDLGCQRVTFEGELNGDEKFKFVAASECFILPTHSENFGMVVAEALACKTPAICSYGAPWAGLNEHQCGWWIPTEMGAFEETMRQAMSMSREALAEMGERGREWMARDFSWDGIGTNMKAAYEWLLGQGEKPDFVRVD